MRSGLCFCAGCAFTRELGYSYSSDKSRGRQQTSLACHMDSPHLTTPVLYGPQGPLMPHAGDPYRLYYLHCHTSSSTARVPVSFCIDEKT